MEKAYTIRGQKTLDFHMYIVNMPNKFKVAMQYNAQIFNFL